MKTKKVILTSPGGKNLRQTAGHGKGTVAK